MSLTDAFADYLIEKSARAGEKQLKEAGRCLSDYTAVTAAGARKNAERWQPLFKLSSGGRCNVIGADFKTDAATAALVNGFNAHCLELDDGQRFAMIHLGASVISALLAAKDDIGFSESALKAGLIMGYEAACRVAIAMQPSHKQRGFHAAGTAGTIGSAVAVAFALGFDQKRLSRALTLSAAGAAGMLEIQDQASELKPYNVGRAAMDGLKAACVAQCDFDAPKDMLGGERGFFNSFSDGWSAEALTQARDYFEIDRIYVKPYASCRHSHSAVEAAIKLSGRVKPDEIESVLVKTYRLGVKGHDHSEIPSVSSAKLSTPYAVAASLLYSRADLSVFEPLDRAAMELAKKVSVIEDASLTALAPQKRAATVCVKLINGKTLSERVDYAKGEPENPMSDSELEEKIRLLALYKAERSI